MHEMVIALDKLIQAGDQISVKTGGGQDANALLVARQTADKAMDAVACIGCEAECPKEISITDFARLNREYIKAAFGSAVK